MKSLNKIVFLIGAGILFFTVSWAAEEKQLAKNVILIGWDGVRREDLLNLLSAGELPNLQQLVTEGNLVNTEVTTGSTYTKPGWVEILTGYNSRKLGIRNNRDYQPIPPGYTIFERLKQSWKTGNIITIFLGGKDTNIGARGPHEICVNCRARDPRTHERTFATDKTKFRNSLTMDGGPQKWVTRQGDPYFSCQDSLDLYRVGLGNASNVAREALSAVEKYQDKPFFAFFHFEDPDETGHRYGEGSAEYAAAIREVDSWLGVIIQRLKKIGLYERTVIYVTTDHGFDKGSFFHENAPETFLAANDKQLILNGDRLDVTPTILTQFGIDLKTISPVLDGKSLRGERN